MPPKTTRSRTAPVSSGAAPEIVEVKPKARVSKKDAETESVTEKKRTRAKKVDDAPVAPPRTRAPSRKKTEVLPVPRLVGADAPVAVVPPTVVVSEIPLSEGETIIEKPARIPRAPRPRVNKRQAGIDAERMAMAEDRAISEQRITENSEPGSAPIPTDVYNRDIANEQIEESLQSEDLDENALLGTAMLSKRFNRDDDERNMMTQGENEMLAIRSTLEEQFIVETFLRVYSYQDMIADSVVTVTVPSADPEVSNSVNDLRMGATDTLNCNTCARDYASCAGHKGIIHLSEPILHPLFINEIIYVLMCIRLGCGGLKLTKERIDKQLHGRVGVSRLRAAAELSKKGGCSCEKCTSDKESGKTLNDVIYDAAASKVKMNIIYRFVAKGVENVLSVSRVKFLFDSLTDEEARAIGFEDGARPGDLILQGLSVAPPNIRPITIANNEERDDHLTYMYVEIVKLNNEIAKMPHDHIDRPDKAFKLKEEIGFLIDNTKGKRTQGFSQPIKSLKDRINARDGGLRRASMGKRVDYSARTVIIPDMHLNFGEVAIPEFVATKVTYPERVASFNRNRLQAMLVSGRVKAIVYGSGRLARTRRLVDEKKRAEYVLRIGDIVHRNIIDGDIALVNRQPTLHRFGMIACRVVIRKNQKVIGIHIANTQGFNADFDGDEMNLHFPQTIEAVVEAQQLASATACILNDQSDKPVAENKLDTITGAGYMTIENRPVDRGLFCDCTMFLLAKTDLLDLQRRAKRFSLDLYTTRVLISALFPRDFYYKQGEVLIRNGIAVSGTMSKAHMGGASRSITHFIALQYGEERAGAFITDANRLIPQWFTSFNMTIGISDCRPLDAVQHEKVVKNAIAEATAKASALGGQPNPAIDPLGAARHESQVRTELDIAGAIGEKIASQYKPQNPLFMMTKLGAKGSASNAAQITSLLGQMHLRGRRILPKKHGGRVLSYYKEGTTDPRAYGFVKSNYVVGVDNDEMFFVMASGREGLVDTGNTTATVGDMNHKLVKAVEDLSVAFDGSVRNAEGMVIQPLYGYDGCAGERMMRTKMPNGDEIAVYVDIHNLVRTLNDRVEGEAADLEEAGEQAPTKTPSKKPAKAAATKTPEKTPAAKTATTKTPEKTAAAKTATTKTPEKAAAKKTPEKKAVPKKVEMEPIEFSSYRAPTARAAGVAVRGLPPRVTRA